MGEMWYNGCRKLEIGLVLLSGRGLSFARGRVAHSLIFSFGLFLNLPLGKFLSGVYILQFSLAEPGFCIRPACWLVFANRDTL